METDYKFQELSEKIIAAAFRVHGELGQGFLEKVYQNVLAIELKEGNVNFELEKPLIVEYHKHKVGEYYADMVVENKIVVEIKAVSSINSAHEVQLVNYLKATGLKLGLLVNFGTYPKAEIIRLAL